MEQLVRTHPCHLILRLPQLAGRSKNPHTLLNYLFAKISREERFTIWGNATRNVIDVDDVVRITRHVVDEMGLRRETINIANTSNHSVRDIVSTFELICGKAAVCDVVDKGRPYPIDVRRITPVLPAAGVDFRSGYLRDVLRKYYG
jgi:nucleoside-diphosphate-sugar epimerase